MTVKFFNCTFGIFFCSCRCLFNFKFKHGLLTFFLYLLCSAYFWHVFIKRFLRTGGSKTTSSTFTIQICHETMTKFILFLRCSKVKQKLNISNNNKQLLLMLVVVVFFVAAFVLTGQTSSGGFLFMRKMSD